MDLLSSGDWLEIRSALKDVKDTFFKMPVTYVERRDRTLSKFHENRAQNLDTILYPLFGLVVYSKDKDRGQVMQSAKGFLDNAEGYIDFDYQALQNFSPSFINSSGKSEFIPNKDTFLFAGEELTILGVDLLGPTETDFQIVQVQFKKNLQTTIFNSVMLREDGFYILREDGAKILRES